jgi:tubulin polyglutamylase TTLL6/13
VVPKVAKDLKWKIIKDSGCAEWDMWWTDWAVTPEVLMKMEHHQKINHFPGMYTLSRKNLLAKNLMKMRKKCPEEYNYFPLTWTLPGDYQEFKAYYETKPKGKARTYIVKPESLSQGKGIFLTRKIDDINPQTHCVVQRYLSKPYLIEGLKFDLRIYVLVAGVDPLRLFIFREGLARFATDLYVTPNKDNMEDICMHLTNYAINKESDKFIFNQDANDMGIGHKRSLESVFGTLREKGADTESLKLKIQDVIVKTIITGLSSLRFQYRSCQS